MKKTIIGYIYRPMDKLGLFQNCSVGQIISKADDNPPWIIVHHSLDDTLAANWPGRLWRAEALGALDPQDHTGNYTRCVSVKIIKEVETEILFGEFGTRIEEILKFASTLQLQTAQHLVNSRHEEAKSITSEGWHRWIKTNGSVDRNPNDDMSGVVAIGGNARKSPIGHGLSLVHRCVREAAKRDMGETAFEEDDEGIWLIQPWSDAAGVLMEAAWAFGAPDLFNQLEIETLLEGWNQRGTKDE